MGGTGAGKPRVTARVQGADVGLLQQAPLHPRHREVLADEAVVLARPHVQEPDVLRAGLAGHLRAEVDLLRRAVGAQADAAAEERDDALVVGPPEAEEVVVAFGIAGEVEEGRAVEEEVALLGKEQREAREVDLPLIDFGLREVGVDGEVGPQQRRQVVEEVDARARVGGRSPGCRGRATPAP